MALEALIFDVDGTLAETEEAHRRAFNDAFQAAGLDWHWNPDLYLHLLAVAGSRERIRHYVRTTHPQRCDDPHLDELIAAVHADKTRRYAERVAAGEVRLRPGVRRVLDEAQAAGLRLAIATSTGLQNVLALLDATLGPGGRARFEVIGAGEQTAAKKPAPDIYRWVLQQLALPPGACLAIEDSGNGLRAAMTAGIATVITKSTYSQHDDFSGAAMVIDGVGSGQIDVARLKRWLHQSQVQ